MIVYLTALQFLVVEKWELFTFGRLLCLLNSRYKQNLYLWEDIENWRRLEVPVIHRSDFVCGIWRNIHQIERSLPR